MSKVEWVKISTEIFSDDKIILIENEKNSEKILLIFFKILCLAGRLNEGGNLILKGSKPYTIPMLAQTFGSTPAITSRALEVLCEYGLIISENGVFSVKNWEKYQNVDAMQRIREQDRKRQKAFRENQKIKANSNVTDNVTGNVTDFENVTLRNAPRIKNKEYIDILKESKKEKDEKNNVTEKHEKALDTDRQLLGEFLTVFPRTGNNNLASQYFSAIIEPLMSESESATKAADLMQAAKNYAESCRILRTGEQFIKRPENFLRDGTYLEYLPEKYKKPEEPKTIKSQKPNFGSMEQRPASTLSAAARAAELRSLGLTEAKS